MGAMVGRDRPARIAIFGPYKSGTTALFYRVLNSLDGAPRTLFEPDRYEPEPGDASRRVLAKVILGPPDADHRVEYETFREFERKLFLVRDPRDWLVSGTLFLIQERARLYDDDERLVRVMDLLRRKERDPASLSLCRLLDEILTTGQAGPLADTLGWIERLHRWTIAFEAGLRDHHRVRYEDLVAGTPGGLERYLGFALTGTADVAPEHDHVPRTKGAGDWKNWFVEEDVRRFRPLFDGYLRHYGYELDWRPSPRPVVRPEHCSEYVARVVAKRRGRPVPQRRPPAGQNRSLSPQV